MAILNYTTSIAAEKTGSEIQAKLAKAGASAVMSEFDDEGVMSAVAFRLVTAHGVADCGLSVDAEHMANASLIAAAPQMLEALKNLENDDGSIPEHAWEIVQRAIKQAEQSYNT